MSNTLDVILEDLKSLSETKLEEAAGFIHALREEPENDGIGEKWRPEIDRRIREIEENRVRCHPAEEVHTALEEKLKDARRISS